VERHARLLNSSPARVGRFSWQLNRRSTSFIAVSCFLCFVALSWPSRIGLTQSGAAFGPETFTRTSASKDVFSGTFAISDSSIPFTLTITNGQSDGSGRVRKGWVSLNGSPLLDPSVFNSQNPVLSLAIHPQLQNTIEIKLKGGQPGSSVTVSINPVQSSLVTDPSSPEFNSAEAGLGMPYGVVIDQATHLAYVADRYYDSVFEFDVAGARISRQFAKVDGDNIDGDGGTTGITFDPKANRIIAINEGVQANTHGSIGIIELDTGSTRTIPLVQSGESLHADYVAVNPSNNAAAFCTLYDGGRTARFMDLASGSIQQSSPTMSLTAPAFNQTTGQFVIAARDDGAAPAVMVYDGAAPFRQNQKIASSAPAGTAFGKLAVNATTNVAIAVNLLDRSASIFDLTAGVELARLPLAVAVGQYGGADVAVDPTTNRAAVISTFSTRLTVIDLNTLLPAWEIPLPDGTRPLGVDIDHQLNRAVVAENGLSSNTRNGSILVVQLPSQ